MVGDNGQNEAFDEYEEFLSKKWAKEKEFYNLDKQNLKLLVLACLPKIHLLNCLLKHK